MTKGPVVIYGPPWDWQPWIEAEFRFIADYLRRKYNVKGVIYYPVQVGESGYPGYTWQNLQDA